MEQRVVDLLSRNRNTPLTTIQILKLINDPEIRKSDVNRFLYKATASRGDLDAVVIPRHLKLVQREQTVGAPRWEIRRRAELYKDYTDDERLGWAVYELAVAHAGECVNVDKLETKHIIDLLHGVGAQHMQEVITTSIVNTDEELLIDEHWNVTYTGAVMPQLGASLDCDAILSSRRDYTHAILLGMGILECVVANPGKKIFLETRIPGNAVLMKHVLKTSAFARSLGLEIVLLE